MSASAGIQSAEDRKSRMPAEMYIVLEDRRERVFAGCNLFPDRAVAEIASDLSFADAVAAKACVLVLRNLAIAQSVAVDG